MSADDRWPRLKLGTHPLLDWVETEYTPAVVTTLADAVGQNPHPLKTRTAAGKPAVWDTALESLLRTLASNAHALDALNHHRPTPPARVRGLNRAVHFHVLRQLEPSGKVIVAQRTVATAWNVTDGQVKDDVAEYRAKGRQFRPDDARQIVANVVMLVAANTGNARNDVLANFAADMSDRAAQLRASK